MKRRARGYLRTFAKTPRQVYLFDLIKLRYFPREINKYIFGVNKRE